MSPFLQALNIGTLAAWLTISGASTVGCLVKIDYLLPGLKDRSDLKIDESDIVDLDNPPAEAAGSAAPDVPSEENAQVDPEPVPVEPIPEIPQVPVIEPLPEIPDLPEPKPVDLLSDKPKPSLPKSQPTRVAAKPASQAKPGGAGGKTGTGTGTGDGVSTGKGASASGADRLSKGRMQKPEYPSDCRQKGQEGRVTVTFTVDEQGNVVSAKVTGATAFPTMNQAALNAVYRWKFPPGARVTASKGIVFNLKNS